MWQCVVTATTTVHVMAASAPFIVTWRIETVRRQSALCDCTCECQQSVARLQLQLGAGYRS